MQQVMTAAAMVEAARSRIENLSAGEVAAEREAGAVLVDVREPEERRVDGVIPGDVFAPRGMIEFWADPTSPVHRAELDPGRRIILYCASGGRSALAADALQRLGFERVAHLDGGIAAWKDRGYPVGRP